MSSRYLIYQSYVFAEPSGLRDLLRHSPSIWQALFIDGVPKSFIGRRYTANASVTLLERQLNEKILCFGTSGLSDVIGVDLTTGHVVEVLNARGSPLLFVNTSIDQFTHTVKAVISRFPYYDHDATDEEIQAAATDLREIIRFIDSAAMAPDRYWSTFADDVEIGDLSTEAILAIDKRMN
jgi:SUKH-4 immunity protein